MKDVRYLRYNDIEKDVWDDPTCNESKINGGIQMNNQKMSIQKILNRNFQDKKAKTSIKRQKNISLFGDKDNDKIPNIFDKNPKKKDKRSKWGLLLK